MGRYGKESINITMDNLKNTMALMKSFDIDDSEKFEYKGELVGINIKNDFFAFISEDGSIIRGKLSKAMKNVNFTIPSFVIALITEQEQVNKLTQEKKKNYTLEKITTI